MLLVFEFVIIKLWKMNWKIENKRKLAKVGKIQKIKSYLKN